MKQEREQQNYAAAKESRGWTVKAPPGTDVTYVRQLCGTCMHVGVAFGMRMMYDACGVVQRCFGNSWTGCSATSGRGLLKHLTSLLVFMQSP